MTAATATSITREGVPKRVWRDRSPADNVPSSRRPIEHPFGICHRGVGGRHQDQAGCTCHGECHDIPRPRRPGQMLRKPGQWRANPQHLFVGRYQQQKQEGA